MPTSPRPNLTTQKVTARIGAEFRGVDLSQDLDRGTVDAIRAALSEHKALVFNDVHLDDAGQEKFARYFGALTTAHPTVPSVHGTPHVLPVDSAAGKANEWHTDVTFVLNPPQASTLRSVVLPPYGGETLIANSAAAYNDLPDVLKSFADSLWAVHTNDYDYVVPPETLTEKQKDYRAVFASTTFETAHPVVRVHPLTGERGLFIGGFAQRIIGLSKSESRQILALLQSYVTRAENILRWRWSPHQLVLFDNRITQHYAIDNYDDQPRRLSRVTIAGEVPVGVEGKTSYSLKGDASQYTSVEQGIEAA